MRNRSSSASLSQKNARETVIEESEKASHAEEVDLNVLVMTEVGRAV